MANRKKVNAANHRQFDRIAGHCYILRRLVTWLRHPILRFMAEEWIVEDALDKSDALIVLGDDNFYADRATRAAQLFREGKALVVVASGRRLRPNAGIAELMET